MLSGQRDKHIKETRTANKTWVERGERATEKTWVISGALVGERDYLGEREQQRRETKRQATEEGMTAEGMRRKIGWKSRLGGWSGRREPPVAGKDRNRPWTRKSQTLTCCC